MITLTADLHNIVQKLTMCAGKKTPTLPAIAVAFEWQMVIMRRVRINTVKFDIDSFDATVSLVLIMQLRKAFISKGLI